MRRIVNRSFRYIFKAQRIIKYFIYVGRNFFVKKQSISAVQEVTLLSKQGAIIA